MKMKMKMLIQTNLIFLIYKNIFLNNLSKINNTDRVVVILKVLCHKAENFTLRVGT